MKLTFLKNIWSKIKKVRVEDALQLVAITAVVLVVVSVFTPELTGPGYHPTAPLRAYFDIFVREGNFVYVYFTFIPLLVLWLVKKFLKKREWNFKTKLLFLIPTLAVLIAVYLVFPGPGYGNPLNIAWLEWFTYPVDSSKVNYFVETEKEFCNQRLDFFYNPGCTGCTQTSEEPQSEGQLSKVAVVQKQLAEKNSPIEFNVWCAGASEDACKEYGEGKYTLKDVKKLALRLYVDSLPVFVIGCKYQAQGKYELEEYKGLICEYLNECDL